MRACVSPCCSRENMAPKIRPDAPPINTAEAANTHTLELLSKKSCTLDRRA